MAKPEPPVPAPRKLARRSFLRGTVGLALGASLAGRSRADAATGKSTKLDLTKLRPYWNEVPNSKITDIAPGSVVADWGGGAFLDGVLYILASGGHASIPDNTVYGFRLSDWAWKKLRDSDPVIGKTDNTQTALWVIKKGPVARHGYSGILGVEAIKKVLVGGDYPGFANNPNLPVVPAGDSFGNNYYDPATNDYSPCPQQFLGSVGCVDPVRNLVFGINNTGETFTVFDPVKDVIVKQLGAGSYSGFNRYSPCAYSPDHGLMVWAGGGLLTFFDLKDPRAPRRFGFAQSAAGVATSGSFRGDYPMMAKPPAEGDAIDSRYGLAYHPPSKRFACWAGGRDVLWLDPAAMTIVGEVTPADAPVPPTPTTADDGGNGVFGRWAYVETLDAFIGYANPNGNVWIYKAPR